MTGQVSSANIHSMSLLRVVSCSVAFLSLLSVTIPKDARAQEKIRNDTRLIKTEVARFSALPATAITDDPRLAQHINLLEGKTYYLGELLEEISRQTGVPVSADETDSASGKRITVVLRDVPLSEALNAVWSLLSYQGASWHWNRTGTEKFTYVLSRSSQARQYGVLTRGKIQKSFEDEAAILFQGLDLTPEERAALAKTKPRAAAYLDNERIRNGLKLLATLPDATLRSVLRGEQEMNLRVTELSPSEQSRAGLLWDNDKGSSTTPASRMRIVTQTFQGGITPYLLIAVGDDDRTTGRGYIGGVPFEKEWQQRLGVEWQLPGDKTGDEREGQTLQKPKVTDPSKTDNVRTGVESPDKLLVKHLSEVSQAVPLSFMARIPITAPRKPIAPVYGATLESYLGKVSEQSRLRHKWRDGILLLEYEGDILAEDSAVPWSFVKELRASEATTTQRVLPLSIMAKAASQLTRLQLLELAEEFPIMTMVAEWQKTFIGLHRSPERISRIVSKRGLRLVEIRPLPSGFEEAINSLKQQGHNAPEMMRISKYDSVGQNDEKTSWLGIYLLNKSGNVVHGQSYPYRIEIVKGKPIP